MQENDTGVPSLAQRPRLRLLGNSRTRLRRGEERELRHPPRRNAHQQAMVSDGSRKHHRLPPPVQLCRGARLPEKALGCSRTRTCHQRAANIEAFFGSMGNERWQLLQANPRHTVDESDVAPRNKAQPHPRSRPRDKWRKIGLRTRRRPGTEAIPRGRRQPEHPLTTPLANSRKQSRRSRTKAATPPDSCLHGPWNGEATSQRKQLVLRPHHHS